MLRKIKRYFADDIESAEKDVAVTIASLLYDVAFDEGIDVLHYGTVFATSWVNGKKNGLDITFGAISPAADGQATRSSVMSVYIEEELNNKFKDSAIVDLKARGAHAFSTACTFLVLNSLNEFREKRVSRPYELVQIPNQQPAARGESKAYAEAVQARNYEEQAKLVRMSSRGPETHLYIKPSLTIGHAATDELRLRESNLEFAKYVHHEGFIR